jgi:hypothetical protein
MKMKTGLEEKYKEYQEANAGDPYSHRCVTYGEMWAAYMEAELSLKPDMSDDEFGVMAGKTGNEADTDGITGYMTGPRYLPLPTSGSTGTACAAGTTTGSV